MYEAIKDDIPKETDLMARILRCLAINQVHQEELEAEKLGEQTPLSTNTGKIENMAFRNTRAARTSSANKNALNVSKSKKKKGASKPKVVAEKTVVDIFRLQYNKVLQEVREAFSSKTTDILFENYCGQSPNFRGVFRCVASRAIM
jgi:hypothetical protein